MITTRCSRSRARRTPTRSSAPTAWPCATWAEDSLATYSLFSDGEAELLRERIELAYRVLSDAESRAAYDRRLGGAPAATKATLPARARR